MNLEPLQPQSLSQPNQLSPFSSGLQSPKPPSKQGKKKKKKKAEKKDFPAPVAVKRQLEKALANGEFEQFAKEYSRIAKAKRLKEEMKKKKNKGKPKIKPTKRSLSAQPWLLSRALWILASVLWPLNRLFCLFALVVITTMLLVGRLPIRMPHQPGDRLPGVQQSAALPDPESGFLEGFLQYHELLRYPERPKHRRVAGTMPISNSNNNNNRNNLDASENSPTFITTHVWFELLFFLQVS